MSDLLKGNFTTKNQVSKPEENTGEKTTLEQEFKKAGFKFYRRFNGLR